MAIQSIIFDKKYWDLKRSNNWIKAHDYQPIKPAHVTKNFIRYRIEKPKPGRYFTRKLENNIELIIRI